MITVLAVHFAVAAVAPFLFRKFRRNSFYVLAAVPAGSFVWLLLQQGAVYQGAAGQAAPSPTGSAVTVKTRHRQNNLCTLGKLAAPNLTNCPACSNFLTIEILTLRRYQ